MLACRCVSVCFCILCVCGLRLGLHFLVFSPSHHRTLYNMLDSFPQRVLWGELENMDIS